MLMPDKQQQLCGQQRQQQQQTTTKRAKAHKLRKHTHKQHRNSSRSREIETEAATEAEAEAEHQQSNYNSSRTFLNSSNNKCTSCYYCCWCCSCYYCCCCCHAYRTSALWAGTCLRLSFHSCICVCLCVCLGVCSLAWLQRQQHFAVYLHRLLLHYFICINCQRTQPPTHTHKYTIIHPQYAYKWSACAKWA